MKKNCCMIAVVFLLLTGCGAKIPNSQAGLSQSELPGSSTRSELSTAASQSHHDEVSTTFMNGMGCSDKNCTNPSHYHDCPADCADYDHYHNCSLDCVETDHHHSSHTAGSGHTEQHSITTGGHHSDSHH